MAIIFATSVARDLEGNATPFTGTAVARDPAFASEEIIMPAVSNSSGIVATIPGLSGPFSNLWVHFRVVFPTGVTESSADGNFMSFGTLQMLDVQNGSIRTRARNGFSTVYGAEWTPVENQLYTFDVNVVNNGTTGHIRLYVDGALVSESLSSDTGAWTDVTGVDFDIEDMMGVSTGAGDLYFSEIIVDDADSTIGKRLALLPPSSAGTYSQWTGGPSDLDTLADNSYATTETADQSISYTPATYGGPTTGNIDEVIVKSHLIPPAAGLTDFSHFLRVGGQNYQDAAQSLASGTYNVVSSVFSTNPNTGVAWDFADLTGLEVGLYSGTTVPADPV